MHQIISDGCEHFGHIHLANKLDKAYRFGEFCKRGGLHIIIVSVAD